MSGPAVAVLVVVGCWLGLNTAAVIALKVAMRRERGAR